MNKEVRDFLPKLIFPTSLVLIIWAVEIWEYTSGVRLTRLGIYPRELDGLTGIITSPFIHGDWQHLISNTFPLFILTTIMMVFYRKVTFVSFGLIMFLTGISVWMFARESYHIGASGVIYGLVSFVFWSGVFRGNNRSIILGLVVLVLYSGYFAGLKPEEGVSWESHLLGALSGIVVAFIFKTVKEDGEEPEEIKFEPTQRSKFLPADAFTKTKYQRWLDSLIDEEE